MLFHNNAQKDWFPKNRAISSFNRIATALCENLCHADYPYRAHCAGCKWGCSNNICTRKGRFLQPLVLPRASHVKDAKRWRPPKMDWLASKGSLTLSVAAYTQLQ